MSRELKKDLVVLTAGSNIYQAITAKLKGGVSGEDYLITTRESLDYVMDKIKMKPMFSKQYILEAHVTGMGQTDLASLRKVIRKELEVRYNFNTRIVFVCQHMGEYEKVLALYEGLEKSYVVLNCYRISEGVFGAYVDSKCTKHLSGAVKKEMWNRLRTQYKLTDVYIHKINAYEGEIDLKVLRKLVPKYNKISFEKMWLGLLLGENQRQIYELYDDYRYGYKFMNKKLLEYCEGTMALYKEFYKGNLTDINKGEWFSLQDKKKKRKLGEVPYIGSMYTLSRYLEVFEKVSYDKLVLISMTLKDKPSSKLEVLTSIMRIESDIY